MTKPNITLANASVDELTVAIELLKYSKELMESPLENDTTQKALEYARKIIKELK